MKLRLVWIGKTKDRRLVELIDEYLHRLAKYVKYDVSELAATRNTASRASVRDAEAKLILAALSPGAYKIALDEHGKPLSSAGLARLVEQHQLAATRELAFIIGGHYGLA